MAIDRKACFQRQLLDISNATDDLDERVAALEDAPTPTVDAYTKAESDAKFQGKLTTSDTISIYSNNEISVDSDYVVTKDSNNNVDGILQVAQLESETWDEDDDCKADITLGSGLRASSINLETSGEESGSRLFLRGSTAVDSEGYIDAYGETRIYTKNRIKVYNNDVTPATEETVAYLSDISGGDGSQLYKHNIKIIKKDGNDNKIGFVAFSILNKSNTLFTTLASIARQMVYEPASGYWPYNNNRRNVVALEGALDPSVMQIGINDASEMNGYQLLILRSDESSVTVSDELVTL